jgi:hypothetical protein
MGSRKVNFQFKNPLSPHYIEPLFLKIEPKIWYESTELQQQLRDSGLDVQGKDIVLANTSLWSKAGLGEVERQGPGRPNLFRLSPLGKQLGELYGTNRALFFDIMHYLFYSAWRRSRHLNQAPFWLYAEVCDLLWEEAPRKMDSMGLTGRLQDESRQAFPEHEPSFSQRSVRAVFPWLGELAPPFLAACGSKVELCSERRRYCTPQLFHLAVDLAYHQAGLSYGTSLSIDDRQIASISRTCLLDPGRFWDMASLADMAMRELEVRQGQWGTSLALTGPPRWIDLPDFSQQEDVEDEVDDEEEDEP